MDQDEQYDYDLVVESLRQSYDRHAQERDGYRVDDWKVVERDEFLAMLSEAGHRRLLEIGAGTGQHALFFQEHGLDVVCTDLSPENVRLCHDKGLTAYVMDFMSLDFPPGSFDAAFALNCLLHVPDRDLPQVLQKVKELLRVGGLFYVGVYGGEDFEGYWPKDRYRPRRFFSFRTNEQIQQIAGESFQLLRFKYIPMDEMGFQGLILRRPG